MTFFKPYDMVRVVQALHPPSGYNGWRVNMRSPQIGDIGAVVEIIGAPNLPDKYIVEAVASDGTTIWLSDFEADEIELVQ